MPTKNLNSFQLSADYELADLRQLPGIGIDSPATDLLLDFRIHPALTLTPQTPVDEAQHFLANSHSTVLLVVDNNDHFCGVVTENCLSEQSIMKMVSQGRKRTELTVGDLMLTRHQISAITYAEVSRSTVEKVISLLRHEGIHSILVVDQDTREIIGILSASELARIFNLKLEFGHHPSFLEIFDAVMH